RANVGLVGLDDGVKDARVLAADVDAAAAEGPVGQAARQLDPRLAGVRRLVKATLRPELHRRVAARVDASADAVGRGVERFWIVRVHGQVDEAGVFIEELDQAPGQAAIQRLVDATLLV